MDIINYDAFNYLDTIFSDDDLRRFISRGGRIAPGVVPSSEEVMKATLLRQMDHLMEKFQSLMIDRLALRDYETLLLPSCGVGSLKPEQAQGHGASEDFWMTIFRRPLVQSYLLTPTHIRSSS